MNILLIFPVGIGGLGEFWSKRGKLVTLSLSLSLFCATSDVYAVYVEWSGEVERGAGEDKKEKEEGKEEEKGEEKKSKTIGNAHANIKENVVALLSLMDKTNGEQLKLLVSCFRRFKSSHGGESSNRDRTVDFV